MTLRPWSTSPISKCHQKFTTFPSQIDRELVPLELKVESNHNFLRTIQLHPRISGRKARGWWSWPSSGKLSKTSKLGNKVPKGRDSSRVTLLKDRDLTITLQIRCRVHSAAKLKTTFLIMRACLRLNFSSTKLSYLQIGNFTSSNQDFSIQTIMKM